jgi:MFS transporter, ACS family, D-galactonate transporter
MTTAPASAAGRSPVERLWNRSLNRYPSNASRYLSLGIVIATTIVLYYQLYLSGGVATSILRDLHMSFTYYVNISVVGYLLGAAASVLAGLADRYGRANIITVGLGIVGLLCLFGLPNAHTKFAFGVIYVAIGFVEGIILVATPALVRDFSPQLGRASAMGFWTLGPVLGSLVVAAFVSGAGNTSWQDQYRTAGIIGLVVFAVALVGLRELAPRLRDQLMVSRKDRELIEARAAGLDIEESLKHPFKQMLKADILLSAFAISVFLIIYYVAVGFFPVFFETVFGYSQSKANALGNYFWSFDAAGLLIVGVISDRLRVRKPFMVLGAVCAIVSTTIFALKATHPETSYTTFKILLSCIAVSLALSFAPWMASFYRDRRAPQPGPDRHRPGGVGTDDPRRDRRQRLLRAQGRHDRDDSGPAGARGQVGTRQPRAGGSHHDRPGGYRRVRQPGHDRRTAGDLDPGRGAAQRTEVPSGRRRGPG